MAKLMKLQVDRISDRASKIINEKRIKLKNEIILESTILTDIKKGKYKICNQNDIGKKFIEEFKNWNGPAHGVLGLASYVRILLTQKDLNEIKNHNDSIGERLKKLNLSQDKFIDEIIFGDSAEIMTKLEELEKMEF